MFWKIVGAVILVWLAVAIVSAVIGALIKGLFWIAIISLVVFGAYSIIKSMSKKDSHDIIAR